MHHPRVTASLCLQTDEHLHSSLPLYFTTFSSNSWLKQLPKAMEGTSAGVGDHFCVECRCLWSPQWLTDDCSFRAPAIFLNEVMNNALQLWDIARRNCFKLLQMRFRLHEPSLSWTANFCGIAKVFCSGMAVGLACTVYGWQGGETYAHINI